MPKNDEIRKSRFLGESRMPLIGPETARFMALSHPCIPMHPSPLSSQIRGIPVILRAFRGGAKLPPMGQIKCPFLCIRGIPTFRWNLTVSLFSGRNTIFVSPSREMQILEYLNIHGFQTAHVPPITNEQTKNFRLSKQTKR